MTTVDPFIFIFMITDLIIGYMAFWCSSNIYNIKPFDYSLTFFTFAQLLYSRLCLRVLRIQLFVLNEHTGH